MEPGWFWVLDKMSADFAFFFEFILKVCLNSHFLRVRFSYLLAVGCVWCWENQSLYTSRGQDFELSRESKVSIGASSCIFSSEAKDVPVGLSVSFPCNQENLWHPVVLRAYLWIVLFDSWSLHTEKPLPQSARLCNPCCISAKKPQPLSAQLFWCSFSS